MDFAITGNPFTGAPVVVHGAGTTIQASSRAAKMNEDKDHKVTNMRGRWAKRRPDLVSAPQVSEEASKVDYSSVIEKNGMLILESFSKASAAGYKKLKVNDLVINKTRGCFDALPKTFEEDTMLKEESTQEIPFTMVEEGTKTLSRYADVVSNDVINTPARFTTPTTEFPSRQESRVSVLPSRSDRRSNEYASLIDNHSGYGLEVGQGEKVLNKIASLNHGGSSEMSSDLEAALLEYEKSEAAKKASFANVRKLEQEVASMEKALERQHADQIAELRAKTEANKEETLGLTMHSEDLKQKIIELRSKLAAGESTAIRSK